MFTLKLYRQTNGQLETCVVAANHVQTMEIGQNTIELWAFDRGGAYKTFYFGKREPQMTALDETNHWGWGLLENAEGKTSERYRPNGAGPTS